MATEPTIQSGLYYVMFAYDAARSISLDSAERRIHEATNARPSSTKSARRAILNTSRRPCESART